MIPQITQQLSQWSQHFILYKMLVGKYHPYHLHIQRFAGFPLPCLTTKGHQIALQLVISYKHIYITHIYIYNIYIYIYREREIEVISYQYSEILINNIHDIYIYVCVYACVYIYICVLNTDIHYSIKCSLTQPGSAGWLISSVRMVSPLKVRPWHRNGERIPWSRNVVSISVVYLDTFYLST